MLSNSTSNALTKEQLFACLEYDGVEVSADKINKAKDNNGKALQYIGYEYQTKKQYYSKAMAWYRLAANQDYSLAYNNIASLYHLGYGVSRDYLTAMEYYLKAARGSENGVISNIGILFSNGQGVPVDKYNALEWYIKSGTRPEQVKRLNKEGIHLREEDKNKTIFQLANEAEDIIRQKRMERKSKLNELKTRESRLKEENDELKSRESKSKEENDELKMRESALKEELNKIKSSNEQEIQKLQNELQQQTALLEQEKGSSTQLVNMEQRLTDKMEIINSLKRESDVYQTLVQSKNNEIDMLKKDNQKYENMEKEILELKRKVEQCSQEPRPLIENSNSTNNATNNTTQLDNQTPLRNTPTSNVDNIIVKTETEPENSNSPSCQNANKKRKVLSNDS